jgi:predicted MPP superfamily phosphohydrolase
MKRIAWVSDIHLNFADDPAFRKFCKTVTAKRPDLILIGGDIGEAPDVVKYLKRLEGDLQMPVYFVLGNHDYYQGSIDAVREGVRLFEKASETVHWLPSAGTVKLTEKTCLIGHGAWADGRLGNYSESTVMINDYFLIDEFSGLDKVARYKKLNQLGDEAASFFEAKLPLALAHSQHVLILTHVPPFKECCWHDGRPCDDNYLPHFGCKAVGMVLKSTMERHPGCRMTVLCGHTHSAGETKILPNLKVKAASSEYGSPILQEMLVVE